MQEVVQRIFEIVAEHFPNGIRNDFIDINKVRRIYEKIYGDNDISPINISDVIRKNGNKVGDRFYFTPPSTTQTVQNFVGNILSKCPIAYYTALYQQHADFFSSLNIFSPEILRETLIASPDRHDQNRYHTDFCTATPYVWLKSEVNKIFDTADKPVSIDALRQKLPYVPTRQLQSVIADAENYLQTIDGAYIHIDKIDFDTDEIDAAKQKALEQTENGDIIALDDLNLSSNIALNPDVPERTLRKLIFDKFLADNFNSFGRGRKLLNKRIKMQNTVSVNVAAARNFIISHGELLPINELADFADERGIARNTLISIAFETMTRIDRNFFLRDNMITFDVDGIDESLSSFVQGKIIPLRAVNSFTGFPPVDGCSWNLFLLESFLRKHSRKFSFRAPALNSRNVGAVYPKSMQFDNYIDVQAAVVIQEKLPIDKTIIKNFLIEHGFKARCRDKTTADIILRAQEIFR